MATTDIVARLHLRAEQFTSETGAAFARLKSNARSSASEIRTEFGGAFADVQRLAQTALRLPRTEAGALNLAPQIAQLTNQANAAEQASLALRELSIAQNAAAASAREGAQALRLEADASAVAALNEEQHAREIRQKIAALEAVQLELNQTTSATRLLTVAENEAAIAGRRAGGGFGMAGQQVTDFTVQVMSGQSAALAFAQQLPQLTYSLIDVGGTAGRIGAFFAGPWGTAITLATVVLTPLIAKLWESEDAGKGAASGVDAYVAALDRLRQTAGAFKFGSPEFAKIATTANEAEAKVARLRLELAKAPAKASFGFEAPAGGSAMIATGSPAPAIRDKALVQQDLNAAIAARDKAVMDRDALLMQKTNYDLANAPKPDTPRKRRGPSAASIATREYGNDTEDKIASMRDRFLEMPPAVRQVHDALREVDDMVRDLNRRQPDGFKETIRQAEALKPLIRDALNKPYRDYVDQQRESLAIGRLTLEGRDAEAEAMQGMFRLQEQMGPLTDQQLETVLRIAEQHERITEALEDQRRIVGIYTAGVHELQSTFDEFLQNLDGNTGSALKDLIGGWVDDLKNVQRNLLSNAIFGGVDREVEKYVRSITGKRTPAEILEEQAEDAGKALKGSVGGASTALDEFVKAVRAASAQISATAGLAGGSLYPVADGTAIFDNVARSLVTEAFDNVAKTIANDNGEGVDEEIIVNGIRDAASMVLKSSSVWEVAADKITSNLEGLVGKLPGFIKDGFKDGVPTLMQGIGFGQLGGSVFSSITGGKDNKLASSVGGVLGNVAGKALGSTISTAIGGALGQTLGSAAGPIGSILGGVLGNVVGGLLTKPQYGTAILTNATDKVSATGRGSSSTKAASGLAGSVQQGLTQLADQLGATLGNFDTVVGMFDGKYRVRTTAAGWDGKGALDFKGNSKNNLHDFGDDQQAAIQFAIADAVRDGAIQGLSAASSRILQIGQDLGKAVEKVTMIESIPKDLKAMLDPVGAAVDALNLKWKRTVDALKEGGASAEQMAQAQRLYDLQLQQTLNSTQAAAATLKDFRDGLKLGSNSPYSLRDQEATALSKLQPYLDQISAGQSVDQDKYRAAAEAFLAVERQMYGSTQAYFDALDTVQAATNRAISAIENVAPITPAVESPFVKATAANTQAVAEMTEQTNALLARIASRLDALGGGSAGSEFVGTARGFNYAANF
jgi:hypothetical protein